ncbi:MULTISPECIES: hypothetical protein [unclassified Streptococcus]|uniref:hypothetical protein n=1 Tax=unclassified Streptococcus TaxID=2608887 RepID=UPI0011B5D359|nr:MULTISPECIES: hypothetical protein [unclassified Streptococcus]TWS94826.1 hypothetical protein FRX52_02595 [Streptococcus sp. sy018]TWT16280.1 hypothetical protein FRX51_03065 [Streptococcus sp. sy010]
MRKFLQTSLYEISFYVEIVISIILVLVLMSLTMRLLVGAVDLWTATQTIEDYLQTFLTQAMTIAVGVELIKMLCKHTSGTIVEVLLFAVARQIVVSHGTALDTLLGVIAIGALFATRKYLFTSFDDSNNIILRGSQKVQIAGILARVKLPNKKGELLRDFMERHLEEEDKSIAVGSTIYIKDVALRVDSMRGDQITRVEIIKSLY